MPIMRPVDIEETKNDYLIKAELPEVRKEDVHITLEEGVLTIQGERNQQLVFSLVEVELTGEILEVVLDVHWLRV